MKKNKQQVLPVFNQKAVKLRKEIFVLTLYYKYHTISHHNEKRCRL